MIKPINDYVLLEEVMQETTTKSGIIVNTEEEPEDNIGLVVAVSDSVKNIKVNDKVIFESYHTKKVKHDGKEYLMISEKDILGIIE
ncbi:MAG TPA: co-chaperone GroES [Tenericutes bacterium]|jgi:chaperonin GroES|nr:co-chaperone GroES [Mycoplasmatota bacterium]